ncbi:Mitochondrial import inner membrane translocase subunit tim22 [Serendipita sp. 407]|nr:Mitochondrial import inner membrane translocase subunit tim22 [Serendipita sp. 405]KAG9055758.1 Mitochondrial import inner membrane translocase subunit tim22 [Serendipita sp. 407]
MVRQYKFLVPLYPAGDEPPPAGLTDEEVSTWQQTQKMEKYMAMASESCIFKSVLSGGLGFGFGAFFSMMSTSFAYDDPLARTDLSMRKKTTEMFKDMGRGMWRTGRSFGRVGALYSGVECVIESVCAFVGAHGYSMTDSQYRARNDMTNAIAGGFVTGGILARNSGPRGAIAGAIGFAAFSTAIEMYLRRDTPDDD